MLLKEVCLALRDSRELSNGCFANYGRAVRYYSDFLGRDSVTQDLQEIKVSQWLAREAEARSKSYARNLRRDFLVVWRFAADLELARQPSSRLVRKPRAEPRTVTAWPVAWIPRLIAACKRLDGRLRGREMSRADYAEAYFRAQIDLLCRPSDIRSLTWASINGKTVKFRQSKTFMRHYATLSQETSESLDRIRGLDPILVFPLSKSATEVMIKEVFLEAKIAKPKKESLGHVRHTGGTEIARQKGCDAARIALGHSPESRVFERHYLSQEKVASRYCDWWRADQQHGQPG